jgi:hypothetical protein
MKCEFCKNEFTNKYIMQKHQQKTKYCINIQKKLNVETKELLNKCKYCDKSFEYDSYKRHQKICTLKKDKTIINLSEEIILLKDELSNLKQTLYKYEIENKRLLVDNLNLEKKLERHEEKLYTIASRPTITTTNTNTNTITNNLLIADFGENTIKNSVENNFTIEHLNEGLKGVAKFTKDYIVKQEDGKKKYICSDPSRAIFKYKDDNGIIQKDIKALKLKNAIKDPIITKSKTLFIEENSKLFDDIANNQQIEDSMNLINDKITTLKDNFLKVKNIDENSYDYAREMVLILN